MHKILEHKATLIIAALALGAALVAGVIAFIPNRQELDTTAVSRMNVSEDVSASGKIDAARHVELSFGRAGTVSSISVNVGDKVAAGQVLASLDAGDLYASLRGAEADIAIQQANLSSLLKGGRPEQVAVTAQSVDTAALALHTTLQDSYLKAVDAVRNKIDQLFTNGGTANPQYNLRAETVDAKAALQNDRITAGEALDDIAARIKTAQYTNADLDASLADFTAIKSLIDAVTAQINLLNTSNSGLSQTDIDSYTSIANGAASELNGAVTAFNNARQALGTASAQLTLTQASGTPDAVVAQEAMVSKAEANASAIKNQIAHALIIAPWDGIVASIVPKEGEAIAANTPAVDLISDGTYTMDVYIPESDIAKVSVGTPAAVSIDAYASSSTIPAHITSVDLSETTVNGVGSYKATVALDGVSGETIRTGMSATATIAGRHADNVLAVPSSALIRKGDSLSVLVKKNGRFIEQLVTTGISGNGYTEISSGLSEGDLVASFDGQ
ncbi:MAG TPA: efflux RND transporter periplasmic adaptor subunit [Candidatus Paceibacterota bacterium]|nr:efflux RND transporter periplasmic adaptor subunit [Candidatus Paceibacterota bacterium]